MAEIHRNIMKNFKTDSWDSAGINDDGVNEYRVFRQGKVIARDTLLNLNERSNQYQDGEQKQLTDIYKDDDNGND